MARDVRRGWHISQRPSRRLLPLVGRQATRARSVARERRRSATGAGSTTLSKLEEQVSQIAHVLSNKNENIRKNVSGFVVDVETQKMKVSVCQTQHGECGQCVCDVGDCTKYNIGD